MLTDSELSARCGAQAARRGAELGMKKAVAAVEKLLPQMLKMGGQAYDNTPLIPDFEKLAQEVRVHADN